MDVNKKLDKIFSFLFVTYILLIFRVCYIANNETFDYKAKRQQNFKLDIINRRANIYDTNLNRITNTEKILKALIIPNGEPTKELDSLDVKIEKEKMQKYIKSKQPFVTEIYKKIENTNQIKIFEDFKRYPSNESYPVHIIGYNNVDGEGMSGLEYYLNEYFNDSRYKLTAYIPLNAKQKPLIYENIELQSTGHPYDGVILTIDNKIQYLLDRFCSNFIKRGAATIINAKTGEIVAISSFPKYNPYNVKDYLYSPEKPLINRALINFSVGSIFKIVTAAAALNSNIDKNKIYNCIGYYKLKDTKYNCHDHKGHGNINMATALERSCNPYFIDIGQQLGSGKLFNMADNMGFNRNLILCDGFLCSKANMPNINMTIGELANFSFGQGKLKASILHIAQMLSCVCNSGKGVVPQLIKGVKENNNVKITFKPIYFDAIKEDIASSLKNMLKINKSEELIFSPIKTIGGKSSTAQTGEYKANKEEMLNTWFCSFSPWEDPKYITVLLKEDGRWGSKDLGPLTKILNNYLS